MPKNWKHDTGQSKAEFEKNYKRVRDIVTKSEGDIEEQNKLSQLQLIKLLMNIKL
jgi:hypothetical protein